jgi:hypothetical protein
MDHTAFSHLFDKIIVTSMKQDTIKEILVNESLHRLVLVHATHKHMNLDVLAE